MRRVATVAAVLLAAALAVVLTGAGGSSGGSYRVDAIFDNASFLVPGQDVRIAGAKVGSVVDVKVTPEYKARIEMSVDRKFAPFRSNADCFIAPQSLIGEKFVQCAPGTPRGHVLVAKDGHAPTVPVSNTHPPVDPDLVTDTFRLPVRQRLALILNELGVGLAGNSKALNDAIRRANPAIQATEQVLRVVDRDRDLLGRLIDRSDQVIAQLADRKDAVKAFIQQAADVSQIAADRTSAVSEGIHRLPATLDEAHASLDTLRKLTEQAQPLLPELQAAAQPLDRLTGDVPALSREARPALRHLAAASKTGVRTLRAGAPIVHELRSFAQLAVPAGHLAAQLNDSLQSNGVVEGIQSFVYNTVLALSRFDADGHILPSYVVAPVQCVLYAETTNPDCDAHFAGGGATTRAHARHHRRAAAAPADTSGEAGQTGASGTGASATGAQQTAPTAPTTTTSTQATPPATTESTPAPPSRNVVGNLLHFLLG